MHVGLVLIEGSFCEKLLWTLITIHFWYILITMNHLEKTCLKPPLHLGLFSCSFYDFVDKLIQMIFVNVRI